jgi:hypothetical protein
MSESLKVEYDTRPLAGLLVFCFLEREEGASIRSGAATEG